MGQGEGPPCLPAAPCLQRQAGRNSGTAPLPGQAGGAPYPLPLPLWPGPGVGSPSCHGVLCLSFPHYAQKTGRLGGQGKNDPARPIPVISIYLLFSKQTQLGGSYKTGQAGSCCCAFPMCGLAETAFTQAFSPSFLVNILTSGHGVLGDEEDGQLATCCACVLLAWAGGGAAQAVS